MLEATHDATEPSTQARIIAALCISGLVLIVSEKLPERAKWSMALLAPVVHELGRAPVARWLSDRGV